ncbi:putative membrane protein [Frankliniella fusca]|uniref:Membrane protein n=1 Tax=Frankliniella fusca TaxID=407009 RepID=A0AAE1LNQ0_9NEOP|nr:putative membrane protein [Frankliniella fusca]
MSSKTSIVSDDENENQMNTALSNSHQPEYPNFQPDDNQNFQCSNQNETKTVSTSSNHQGEASTSFRDGTSNPDLLSVNIQNCEPENQSADTSAAPKQRSKRQRKSRAKSVCTPSQDQREASTSSDKPKRQRKSRAKSSGAESSTEGSTSNSSSSRRRRRCTRKNSTTDDSPTSENSQLEEHRNSSGDSRLFQDVWARINDALRNATISGFGTVSESFSENISYALPYSTSWETFFAPETIVPDPDPSACPTSNNSEANPSSGVPTPSSSSPVSESKPTPVSSNASSPDSQSETSADPGTSSNTGSNNGTSSGTAGNDGGTFRDRFNRGNAQVIPLRRASELIVGQVYSIISVQRINTRFGPSLRAELVDDRSPVGRSFLFYLLDFETPQKMT